MPREEVEECRFSQQTFCMQGELCKCIHEGIRLGVLSILLLKGDNTGISCTHVKVTAALANFASHIQSPVSSYKPVLLQ